MSGRRYVSLEARLVANSAVCEETGCWNWLGALHPKGYGRITMRVKRRVRGRSKSLPVSFWAHRVAYECFEAVKLATDETVDHKCNNVRCINPEHLQVVSRMENTRLQWVRRRYHEEHGSAAPF